MRADEAHLGGAAGHLPVARWTATVGVAGDQAKSRLQARQDLVLAHEGVGAYVIGVAERHLLDETDIDAAADSERDQRLELVVVDAAQHHRIELDAGESRRQRSVNAGQHFGQVAGAGDGAKALGV